MKIKIFLLASLIVLMLLPSAEAAKKPVMKKVYMFGFAASFTDSLAFQTDIQTVDSAWLMPNGFLVDRPLYSLQMQYYVEGRGGTNSTCTVFFAEKEKKLKKVWDKIHKRYSKTDGVKLLTVTKNEFQFRPEQYIENFVNESDDVPGGTAPVQSAKH
ncbi:MAG: hypothetical protein K6F94_06860 [Bacteroidaceae bacterium]|nr:hypothetical protein [Bacteroidaceae bacterium]